MCHNIRFQLVEIPLLACIIVLIRLIIYHVLTEAAPWLSGKLRQQGDEPDWTQNTIVQAAASNS